MILSFNGSNQAQLGILHVCGDDPQRQYIIIYQVLYSPRMWRWSLTVIVARVAIKVFSTYVEMILSLVDLPSLIASILHVCGDDPMRKGLGW